MDAASVHRSLIHSVATSILIISAFISAASAATANSWQVPPDASSSSTGVKLAWYSYTQIYFSTDYPAYSLILKPKGYPDPTSAWGLKWYPILYGNASLAMPYLFYLGNNVDLSGGNVFRLSVVNGTTGPSNTEAYFDTADITVVPTASPTTGAGAQATPTGTTLVASSAGAVTTTTTGASSANTQQASSTTSSGGSGSSNSTAIGAGVGVGVGVPLILGLIALGVFLQKRKGRQRAAAGVATYNASTNPANPVRAEKARPTTNELHSRPVEELPAYTEMGGGTVRGELP